MRSIIKIFANIYFAIFAMSAVAQSESDSIFWKATRFNKTIYILGVTHVGFGSQYPINNKILKAFKISESYITESHAIYANEDEINSMASRYFLAASKDSLGAIIKNNRECSNLARSENLINNIKNIYGSELSSKILKLSPSYLIFLSLSSNSLGKNNASSEKMVFSQPIEHYLHIISINTNMHRKFLDPEYWEAIQDLSDYEKCKLATGLVIEKKEIIPYIDQYKLLKNTQKLWSQGNALELERTYFSPLENYIDRFEEIKRKNFALRNKHMVEKILFFSGEATQPIFVAVGAAHLMGELGIVKILKNSGYVVTPQ